MFSFLFFKCKSVCSTVTILKTYQTCQWNWKSWHTRVSGHKIYFNEVQSSLFFIVSSQNRYRIGVAKEHSRTLLKNVSTMLYTEHLYGWDDSSARMLIQSVALTETANEGATCQLALITVAFSPYDNCLSTGNFIYSLAL